MNNQPTEYTNRNGYKRHLKPTDWQPPDLNKCQGFASHSGNQCKNPPAKNSSYCRIHGTKGNRGGTNNPNYKHGGRSKVIKQYIDQLASYPKMLKTFLSSLDEENQTDPTAAIAVMDAVIIEKLNTIDFGDLKHLGLLLTDVKSLLTNISGATLDYDSAVSNSDPQAAAQAFNDIKRLTKIAIAEIGSNQAKLKSIGLEELERSLERRTKMASEKVKIKTSLSQSVPTEVNLILINLVVADMMNVVDELVKDDLLRNKIITAFDARLKD